LKNIYYKLTDELNVEALVSAKLGGLKKKFNEESWNSHMENLMKI